MPRSLWYPIPAYCLKSGFWKMEGSVISQRLSYYFNTRLDYIAAVINDSEKWPLHVIV